MNQRRQERNLFLLFLGASLVAVMAALPIVVAQTHHTGTQQKPAAVPSAAAGASQTDQPNFARVDRNKDGFVDKSEAGVVPGMSANFERADRNRDGKLDEAEFAKGLQILSVRR
jgi:hypothetical protein